MDGLMFLRKKLMSILKRLKRRKSFGMDLSLFGSLILIKIS